MAKFKVALNNMAGALDARIVDSEGDVDGEDGLPFSKFIFAVNDMMNAAPIYHGDSITVELIEEGT